MAKKFTFTQEQMNRFLKVLAPEAEEIIKKESKQKQKGA